MTDEGRSHDLRSQMAPAYLGTADPGYNGGGTVQAGDPGSMMANYENIFGPAVRDIKWDQQRHKRHQRWHLPDALKGASPFLTDRVDGLITDATSSPFTKNILPYHYMEQPDRKFKWNVYSFDEGIASRVPYESAARVLPQSKRSFAGYAVRQGLAIVMEHNFMMSPQGMDNFRKQLMQLVGSIQLTNDLDVHMALLYAPSYQKHMDEKYHDTTRSVSQNCRMYIDLFGFMQKNENALDYLIEDAKLHLKTWGSQPPTFLMCNGSLTRQLTMTPQKTNYITAGPDGKVKLAQGPDLPSYRGLSIINTRQFSLEAGTAPRDMLRRRVRVMEHYDIKWHPSNLRKRYEFYDQSRDSMFYLSWETLWKASFPQPEAIEHFFMQSNTPGNIPDINSPDINMHDYFTQQEFRLCAMLGFFADDCHYNNGNIKFAMDLDFVVENEKDDKKSVKVLHFALNFLENQSLLYKYGIILIKLFIMDNFPRYTLESFNAQFRTFAHVTLNTLFNPPAGENDTSIDLSSLVSLLHSLHKHTVKPTFEKYDSFLKCTPCWSKDMTSVNCKIRTTPMDLLLLRPCIEHYMLAVIIGRGGGKEELGATFWGQTELSCYDDAQHGIWGMSYKYHERAVVTNERNLIRVFDVCFDGYCGGNDSTILRYDNDSINTYKAKALNQTEPYNGPSMIVMALPQNKDELDTIPNPCYMLLIAGVQPRTPDRNLHSNNTDSHVYFKNGKPQTRHYQRYYHALGFCDWDSNCRDPGHLAWNDETENYQFSFQGHMGTILDGQREELQGSGHLGPNYVGVAAVREGRGMMPRGMPGNVHLV